VHDWDRLVREHGPTVYGAAWRVLGQAADAEDVVQEVFIEADRIRQTRRVRHWGGLLRRLATCRSIDRLRQRKVTQPLDGLLLANPAGAPDEVAIEHELADRLRVAIAQLPEREASVFCLRYFQDLTNRDIADTLHVRPGAVAVALHKARARLETLLNLAPASGGREFPGAKENNHEPQPVEPEPRPTS
jgi:RNA polymerase sigma-70 factor, ECF subfamily